MRVIRTIRVIRVIQVIRVISKFGLLRLKGSPWGIRVIELLELVGSYSD